MFRDGWIKLWRQTLDSGIIKHPNAWQVFGYSLLMAVHDEYSHKTRYGIIKLQPGQFVNGRKKMAEELSLSEQNIRSALKLLVNKKILTIKTTKQFSIITLVNWEYYQKEKQTSTKELTNSQPTANQQLTTDKECKEGKEHIYTPEFLNFWQCYPAREGKKNGKLEAQAEWNKIKPNGDLLEKIMNGVLVIKAEKFPLDACRWLKRRRWTDETVKSKNKYLNVEA